MMMNAPYGDAGAGYHQHEGPPGSRLFIVCGKAAEEALLVEAFQPFGLLQSVKLLRDKGVAYIKYDKASSAAAAQEHLHESVLSDGRTKLKVFLAEAPHARRPPGYRPNEVEVATDDPENIPPRSRLFIVVPKNADAGLIQDEMALWPDLQYCKTDLISAKGVVFCKFARSSAALRCMEAVNETCMLAGYKVKCMLAEPKGKRGRADSGGGSLDNGPSWDNSRGAASPSTSGSRGGEHATPFRDQRGQYLTGHGLSPAHSRSLTSNISEGRSLTPAHSAGFTGIAHNSANDLNLQLNMANAAQIASIAALQGYASLANANAAQAGLSAAQAQQLLASGLTAQQLQTLAAQGLLQQAAAQAAQQQAQQQQQQGLGSHSQALGGSQGYSSQQALTQQALAHQQGLGSGGGQLHRPQHSGGGNSDGSLSGLAGQQHLGLGLGGATGLGLGVGHMGGLGSPGLGTRSGLEGLTLGSLIGGLTSGPPTHSRGFDGSGHNAELSSAGSMSVCTTSGMRSSEPLNRQRLFVVCHKAATEDMLRRLFCSWPGLEYLDLKRDRTSGQSKGFCYVNYSSREAAAAAMDQLNGVEWPNASGARLKVMYAEPLGSRAPGLHRTPPPGSASRPAPSDSFESAAAHGLASPIAEDETSSRHRPLPAPDDPVLPSPRRFPLPTSIAEEVGPAMYGEDGGFGGGASSAAPGSHRRTPSGVIGRSQTFSPETQNLQQEHTAEAPLHTAAAAADAHQAARAQQLQERPASQPEQQAQQAPHRPPSQPQAQQPTLEVAGKSGSRKQAAAAAPTTSDMNWESADAPGAEERRVYTLLPRPLPDYALEHVFSAYGTVEFVRLQSDARYGVVQFTTQEAAAAALTKLATSDICGLALTLNATDPLQPERNSKRPRVAP